MKDGFIYDPSASKTDEFTVLQHQREMTLSFLKIKERLLFFKIKDRSKEIRKEAKLSSMFMKKSVDVVNYHIEHVVCGRSLRAALGLSGGADLWSMIPCFDALKNRKHKNLHP